jgi:hypothetical protein
MGHSANCSPQSKQLKSLPITKRRTLGHHVTAAASANKFTILSDASTRSFIHTECSMRNGAGTSRTAGFNGCTAMPGLA